jgi:hypothetical protein
MPINQAQQQQAVQLLSGLAQQMLTGNNHMPGTHSVSTDMFGSGLTGNLINAVFAQSFNSMSPATNVALNSNAAREGQVYNQLRDAMSPWLITNLEMGAKEANAFAGVVSSGLRMFGGVTPDLLEIMSRTGMEEDPNFSKFMNVAAPQLLMKKRYGHLAGFYDDSEFKDILDDVTQGKRGTMTSLLSTAMDFGLEGWFGAGGAGGNQADKLQAIERAHELTGMGNRQLLEAMDSIFDGVGTTIDGITEFSEKAYYASTQIVNGMQKWNQLSQQTNQQLRQAGIDDSEFGGNMAFRYLRGQQEAGRIAKTEGLSNFNAQSASATSVRNEIDRLSSPAAKMLDMIMAARGFETREAFASEYGGTDFGDRALAGELSSRDVLNFLNDPRAFGLDVDADTANRMMADWKVEAGRVTDLVGGRNVREEQLEKRYSSAVADAYRAIVGGDDDDSNERVLKFLKGDFQELSLSGSQIQLGNLARSELYARMVESHGDTEDIPALLQLAVSNDYSELEEALDEDKSPARRHALLAAMAGKIASGGGDGDDLKGNFEELWRDTKLNDSQKKYLEKVLGNDYSDEVGLGASILSGLSGEEEQQATIKRALAGLGLVTGADSVEDAVKYAKEGGSSGADGDNTVFGQLLGVLVDIKDVIEGALEDTPEINTPSRQNIIQYPYP